MPLTLIPRNTYRTMPWKNGGGETSEIAVSPRNASVTDFDWRISMARVDGDGPFSVFPGVDRSLSVLQGAGITLASATREATLTPDSAPFDFPADHPVEACLIDGPITDLNVMTRRARCNASVTRLTLDTSKIITVQGSAMLVLARSGGFAASSRNEHTDVSEGDTLLVTGHDTPLKLAPADTATLYLIEIFDA